MSDQEQPPSDSGAIVDLLRELIRTHYVHAAQNADGHGAVYEAVADTVMKAHAEITSGGEDGPVRFDVARSIDSSLAVALRSMRPATPEFTAVARIRRLIASMGS